MATQGDLISFRPDVRVLDATLRDGGLVNNFRFSDEFVKDLYKTNIKSNIDYMELQRRFLIQRISVNGNSATTTMFLK